jgi:hypothetical protein
LFYISELEDDYPDLAKQLQPISEVEAESIKTVEAIEDITYFALLSEKTRVTPVFDIMIKFGTPSPTDFAYEVPSYNLQLLGLYQLAEDNKFDNNDLIAVSVVIMDGVFLC